MEQPIILDDAIAFDDGPTSFIAEKTFTGEEFPEAINAPIGTDFASQEQWINAIAHCPFLSPDHRWKTGSLQFCIGFIPAEPMVDDESIDLVEEYMHLAEQSHQCQPLVAST